MGTVGYVFTRSYRPEAKSDRKARNLWLPGWPSQLLPRITGARTRPLARVFWDRLLPHFVHVVL